MLPKACDFEAWLGCEFVCLCVGPRAGIQPASQSTRGHSSRRLTWRQEAQLNRFKRMGREAFQGWKGVEYLSGNEIQPDTKFNGHVLWRAKTASIYDIQRNHDCDIFNL